MPARRVNPEGSARVSAWLWPEHVRMLVAQGGSTSEALRGLLDELAERRERAAPVHARGRHVPEVGR